MQASTMILTNELVTFTIKIPSLATDKLEPIDDDVLVLFDSKDDVCDAIELFNTSPFMLKKIQIPLLHKVL